MKKIILIGSLSMLLIGNSNCIKNSQGCTAKLVQNEQAVILAYASANNINGTTHPSGVYYEIVAPGTGTVTPVNSSSITISYVGKLISNNSQFDARTAADPLVYPLGGLIPGWQIGIPLIKKGGTIKMIIPSSLAYGCTGRGSIPQDAVLFFEVTLIDIQ